MCKKDTKKEVYDAPTITKYQVLLEQVIAAGSNKISSDGNRINQEWTYEDIYNDDYYTLD